MTRGSPGSSRKSDSSSSRTLVPLDSGLAAPLSTPPLAPKPLDHISERFERLGLGSSSWESRESQEALLLVWTRRRDLLAILKSWRGRESDARGPG
eukprot:CAMPEP_0170188730 /NCGR_PEP_ID=MMETSP0040_2-20121228/45066_1 /TAXON_ID=641309 /ORGANISM="Lotharella oceanica, Strain CCMP622" /LENGTH=95 /DNA_ID=CAMNT_0010436095 /DNA_START=495 /DNA_END=778 /DNA_ORIENTATION=-